METKVKKANTYHVENVEQIEKSGFKTLVCNETGERIPLSEYQITKQSYFLSHSLKDVGIDNFKDISDFVDESRPNTNGNIKPGGDIVNDKKVKGDILPENSIIVRTLRGVELNASTKPFLNAKKASSNKSKKVLYFTEDTKRSDIVSAYRNETGVDIKNISVKKVKSLETSEKEDVTSKNVISNSKKSKNKSKKSKNLKTIKKSSRANKIDSIINGGSDPMVKEQEQEQEKQSV